MGPDIVPYSLPNSFRSDLHIFLETHFNIIPHLPLELPSGPFLSDFQTKFLYGLITSPLRINLIH